MSFDVWFNRVVSSKRRKSIPSSIMKKALIRSRGYCEMCGLDFYESGVTPHFHHKNGNPSDNRLSNILVVCPNCHSKLTRRQISRKKRSRRRKRSFDPWRDSLLDEIDGSLSRLY